ncbi:MAG: UDP-glucose 4-epimerase [Rickettsiaceae bacterium]|jgi:dTDP-glucose 4,6-dehydratase|nr:UDP-glucose 4-epimerase [Rickettsiaceae bacterium]
MRKIAVTGAQGLIGKRLIENLEGTNITIKPIDIRYNAGEAQQNVDITHYNDIEKVIADCEGVVHLAAVSRVVWGEINPELCFLINVEGTKNIIKACLASKRNPWLIYASSREVYGQQKTLPVIEDASFSPLNHYAKSKCIAEELVNLAAHQGLQTSIVRFSGVFGGLSDHFNRVVPAFCTNALANKPLFVEGEDCLFDFTYVDDAVSGLIKIFYQLFESKGSLVPIHLTSCQPASLIEIADYIIKLTNSSSEILIKPPRNFDVSKFYGDFSRARSLLGWRPEYTLSKALKKFIEEIKNAKALPIPVIKRGFDESLESYSWLPAAI